MTTASFSGIFSITPRKIAASVFGLLLLVSAFLPWLSPTTKLGSYYSSTSGMDVSKFIGLAAILGGLLVIALAWAPFRKAKGGLHIFLGVAVLAVLVTLLLNKTLPLLSTMVRTYVSTGFGVYLYALSGLAVAIIGLTELPKRRLRIKKSKQVTQPYPAQAYGAPMQPLANMATAAVPFCPNCGMRLNPGAAFCPGCGTPVAVTAPAAPVYAPPAYQPAPARPAQKVSGAWWLLPIFLGFLGGLIAFFAVLKRKPGMAVAMLILGIVISVVAFLIIRNIIANSLSNLGVSVS